eukprot:CAMPEP_0185035034 /NCGR_PEP_ID=MMETSP1103-20130426/25705_1 /TAXON_ID=36769 /ORGANISM="Paraphysomonas bandaiensis, Strain Caron Lab Isolate" /LENGTH=468 /DNA_ID=CAMNT_0027571941 /DNA_START=27 /DNA_END=1430 /DNA_ORIENTATION=-
MSEGAHAVVVVLGDTGRSPRMQYHAISLAALPHINRVTLIGYPGEVCNELIVSNPAIHDIRLTTSSAWIDKLRPISLLHAAVKGVFLVLSLLFTLFRLPHIDMVVVQNPPAIPALLACLFMSYFNGMVVLLDWHNLGFSMYFDRYSSKHVLVRVSRILEGRLGVLSDRHICVSDSMGKWLHKRFNVSATTLYDKPPAKVFKRFSVPQSDADGVDLNLPQIDVKVRHELLLKLKLTDEELFPHSQSSSSSQITSSSERTIQTVRLSENGNDTVTMRDDRAVILVTATSWSPDEDFGLLMKALCNLDRSLVRRRSNGRSLTQSKVVMVITGKGPMRDAFMQAWKARQENPADRLVYVSIVSVWLEIADYPLMIACADLGICLHTSTSGLDLPMKVLDMFGCGVPVCAIHYPALPELLKNGENGIIYRQHNDLAAQLYRLFCEAPNEAGASEELCKMRKAAYRIGSWEDNW